MPNPTDQAVQNLRAAMIRAHDRLSRPLNDRDRLRKSGPKHRRRKHDWDFTTLGASYFARHARRYKNLGAHGPAWALGALAAPTALLACSGVGFVPRIATATLKWTWYFGYDNPQGDDSLRKDLVQYEIQEALAELQVMATYAEQNPAQKYMLQPFWREARTRLEAFEAHLHALHPKVGGSKRLHAKLHNFRYLIDAHI